MSKRHHKGFNVSVSFYCSGKIPFFKREDSSFWTFHTGQLSPARRQTLRFLSDKTTGVGSPLQER